MAFCGAKRSGKDASAAVFCRHYQFQQCSFASFLKEACRSIFLLSHDQLYGDEKDEVDARWGVCPRELFQIVGTDLFRQTLPTLLPRLQLGRWKTLWVRSMELWLETFQTPQRLVIPDLRFLDEAEFVRSLGGKIVRVEREGQTHDDPHVSEHEYRDILADYVLSNAGTLQQLELAAFRLAGQIVPTAADLLHRPVVRGLRLEQAPRTVADLEQGEPVTLGADATLSADTTLKSPHKRPREEEEEEAPTKKHQVDPQ